MNARALQIMAPLRTERVRRGRAARGFTLVELMIVVAMIGVLASIALVAYKQQLNAAHVAEAKAVMQAIRAAEEVHKAETLVYLRCSAGYDGGSFYPQGAGGPNDRKWNFRNPGHADVASWDRLHVTTDAPVRFAYAVVAGSPGEAIPAMSAEWASPPVWPAAPAEPWYVIQATGNLDFPADSLHSLFVVSSLSGELYSENETE
jgi:type IV pilus assembly protein PilA